MRKTILIVDDEEDIRLMVQGLLEDEGYRVFSVGNSDHAYDFISQTPPDLIVQDIWLQGSKDDGIDILKKVKDDGSDIPFIMISGHGTIETAVSTIKYGAYDFIEKPFNSDRLLLMVHRAFENLTLKRQNAQLKAHSCSSIDEQIVQISESVRHVIDKVSQSNSRVFLAGEVGTGKNLAAQYIHEKSLRGDKPFMTLNCTGKTVEALEVELFGKGSNVGLLELTDGGTLVFDEVLSLPIGVQGKVLSLLQEDAYCRVGERDKIPVDVRVIASTSLDPDVFVQNGSFREDLYYRLNVVPIDMVPLRSRKQDIPEVIKQYSGQMKFTKQALQKLQAYPWPGNIKQLHNVLEWISIIHSDEGIIIHSDEGIEIDVESLPPDVSGMGASSDSNQSNDGVFSLLEEALQLGLRDAREHFERYYLLSQVNRFDGNISKTAEFIGMERSALHRKLKSLDVFSDDKQNVA